MPNQEPNAEPLAHSDDKDDVEGHGLSQDTESPLAKTEEDEEADVEGHVFGGQPNASPNASPNAGPNA
jgi:hypothetical protein